MTRNRQKEETTELVDQFKGQVGDESLILRLEQLEEESIYELFETYDQYERIYG